MISAKENVTVEDATLDELLSTSGGDMRKAVTFLQSCHQLTNGKASISPAMVVDVSGKVPHDVMENFWKVVYEYSFDNVKTAVQDIVYLGYPMAVILSQLFDDLMKKKMTDLDKALICEKLAEV